MERVDAYLVKCIFSICPLFLSVDIMHPYISKTKYSNGEWEGKDFSSALSNRQSIRMMLINNRIWRKNRVRVCRRMISYVEFD